MDVGTVGLNPLIDIHNVEGLPSVDASPRVTEVVIGAGRIVAGKQVSTGEISDEVTRTSAGGSERPSPDTVAPLIMADKPKPRTGPGSGKGNRTNTQRRSDAAKEGHKNKDTWRERRK